MKIKGRLKQLHQFRTKKSANCKGNNSNVKVYELLAHFIDSFGIFFNEFQTQ